jgi:hypothetical protein
MVVEMEAEAIAIKKEMVVNMEADNVRWSELYPFSDPSKLQVPSLLIRSRLARIYDSLSNSRVKC